MSQGVVQAIGAEALVALLEAGLEQVVLIDSRPFVDYNSSHILEAISVNCSKLMKRRLQQDKVHIQELLQHSARKKVRPSTVPPPPAATSAASPSPSAAATTTPPLFPLLLLLVLLCFLGPLTSISRLPLTASLPQTSLTLYLYV